jgi:hypothetical protein
MAAEDSASQNISTIKLKIDAQWTRLNAFGAG